MNNRSIAAISDIKYQLERIEETYYGGVAEDYIALGLYETCLLRLSKQIAKDTDLHHRHCYSRYTKLMIIAHRLQREIYK